MAKETERKKKTGSEKRSRWEGGREQDLLLSLGEKRTLLLGKGLLSQGLEVKTRGERVAKKT